MKVFVVITHDGCDNPWCPGTQEPSAICSTREKAEDVAGKLKREFRHIDIKEMVIK